MAEVSEIRAAILAGNRKRAYEREMEQLAERESLIAERDRARELVVTLESAIAKRDSILRDARALLRHDSVCAVNGPRWIWDQTRQLSTCRACGAEYDVDRPGHRHPCDCGRDALVARIDGSIGGESRE